MRIILAIAILLITYNAYADINVSGGIKYTTPTKTIIQQPTEPANPTTNMVWQNPETEEVKRYDGTKWKNMKSDAKMTKYKSDFKNEVNQIADIHAKKAIEILGKGFFETMGEDL
jgi:hypothetical protein